LIALWQIQSDFPRLIIAKTVRHYGKMEAPSNRRNDMKDNVGYFKKNFADFLAKYDNESYDVHKEKKEQLFADIHGTVLEVGPGTGVNFPFLKDKSIHWTGVEPNPAMHPYLNNAAKKYGITAHLLDCITESISLPDNAVDYVISTEVLCSVNDLDKSLTEIKRVLKPNGKFLFLEHVVDKQNIWRRTVQKFVPFTPWKYFSDGCRPARDIGTKIKQTGFSDVQYVDYMREGRGIIITINRPHIYGWARK